MADKAVKMAEASCQFIAILGVDFMSENVRAILDQASFEKNLSHPHLGKAIKAFGHLRIRIGGSLQDQILYDVPSLKAPCHPFFKKPDGLFGFSTGCRRMQRWDVVKHFFAKNRVLLTFGLNALYGRHKS